MFISLALLLSSTTNSHDDLYTCIRVNSSTQPTS